MSTGLKTFKLKVLHVTLILCDKHEINFTWEMIFSFIWVVLHTLSECSMQTRGWNSVKERPQPA